ncbi:hypothetical protein [Prevotella sp. KH2C16]|uniref:hypothetical protein n=1 Tax=Prevotella sp. KH2C16 TaxID=1855325 RepID=UPI0008F21490|nr:hypothetical protein [Prevotella sp. KH2C16]SFG75433.1 hypothetical protein SAMN05216383_1397 [Prevotella sp. KH2C16]
MVKRITYGSDRELECLRYLSKCYDFALSLSISLALNELDTAAGMLRDGRMFRHGLKKYVNNAVREGDRRRAAITGYMVSRGFFESYADRVIDLAEKDIAGFRNSVRRVMEKHGIGDAGLYAQVETARCLLQACVLDFRGIAEEARKKFGVARSGDFAEYDVSAVYYWFGKAADILYADIDRVHGDIELRTPATARMFNRIHRKIADGEYIGGCMETASEEHPEFMRNEIKKAGK